MPRVLLTQGQVRPGELDPSAAGRDRGRQLSLQSRQPGPLVAIVLPLAFFVYYGAGVVLVVNTAHDGGRMLHELGVRVLIAKAPLLVAKLEVRGN